MANAQRDQNRIPTLIGTSSTDGVTPINVYVDPTTHRLLADFPSAVGTVTSVSVVTANGVSGSVATATTTPAITLTLGVITPTSVNGLTLASQAVGFTIAGGTTSKTLTVPLDASVSGTNTGDQTNISGNAGTVTNGVYTTSDATVLAATSVGNRDKYLHSNAATGVLEWSTVVAGTGTVTTVSVVPANGFAGTVANATTAPAITLTTSITGLLKGNGTAISAATAGTDYAVGSTGLAGGQTIAGSTLTNENLTLRANAADLTTGQVNITSSKEATNTTTASVALSGGLAVAKRVYALDMTVTNTITGSVSGSAATVTGATQTAITTLSNLVTVGTITSGGLGAGATLGAVTMNIASQTANDMLYVGASNVLTRVANGTTGQVWTATTGAAPSWSAPPASSSVGSSYTVNSLWGNAASGDGMALLADGTVVTGIANRAATAGAFTANAIEADSNNNTYPMEAMCVLDATHVAVVYRESVAAKYYAKVGVIGANGAITWGTAAQLPTTAKGSNSGGYGIIGLSSTLFVINYSNTSASGGASGTLRFVAGNVSGTTITLGADATVSVTNMANMADSQSSLRMVKMDSSTFVMVGREQSTIKVFAIAGSVDGTPTITLGSLVEDTNSSFVSFGIFTQKVAALSSTLFVFGNGNSSSGTDFYAGTLSGTTITLGSVQNTTNIATNSAISLYPLDATHFFAANSTGSATQCLVASVSGTTITFGSAATYTTTSGSTAPSVFGVPLSASSFALMIRDASGFTHLQPATVSGVTTTLGADIIVDGAADWAAGNNARLISPSAGQVIGFYSDASFQTRAISAVIQNNVPIQIGSVTGILNTGTDGSSPFFAGALTGVATVIQAYDKNAQAFLFPTGYVGVASAAANVGASLTVTSSGVSTAFTGLVAESMYYLSVAGAYSTIPSIYPLGQGVSSIGISLLNFHANTINDPSIYQASPSDPTGTTNTSGLMMGLGGFIVPKKTGNVHITISGTITNNTGGDGANVQLRYGTGAIPANAGALTGTTVAGLVKFINPTALTTKVPFMVQGIVTGLTLGTRYWIDTGLAAVTGGTASITDVGISAYEI